MKRRDNKQTPKATVRNGQALSGQRWPLSWLSTKEVSAPNRKINGQGMPSYCDSQARSFLSSLDLAGQYLAGWKLSGPLKR